MGQLVFQATLGGQVNLVGPNTASTFNLNVPAVSSTIATLAAQTFAGTQTFTVDASISGLTVGKGGGSDTNSTVFGNGAGAGTNTGGFISAFGFQSLNANTSGIRNTAIGYKALPVNTTGSENTGNGHGTLFSNTTGSNNTAIGSQALLLNTTASYNTAVGYQAGYAVTTGQYNCLLGYITGTGLTTGGGNTFVGGGGCATLVTTGSNNTVIGNYSGNQGGLDIRTASNYIVLSDGAGNPRGIFDSSGNLLVGATSQVALERLNVTGGSQTGIMVKNTGGNTYSPIYSWNATTTGDGYFAAFFTEASQTFRGSITYNRTAGLTAYNTTSDYRAKTVNGPVQNALSKVALLKPSTGRMNGATQDIDFFVAHELQEVVPSAVSGEKDAVNEDNTPKYQVVDKSAVIPLLTAAIQELKAINDTQAETINALTARVVALEAK
jgi:hypothetical protein